MTVVKRRETHECPWSLLSSRVAEVFGSRVYTRERILVDPLLTQPRYFHWFAQIH